MNDKTILVDKIKRWLEIENKILSLQRELKEVKKNKKQISLDLTDIMKSKNLDSIDVNQGKILYTKNKSKKGINKKFLEDVLNKFYEDNNKAKEICEYILENRETVEKENIR
jgi:bifunctional N-acetylglucosamine-1-phosphate-uridyltransferase/glucosamine-1-phosphate-acetyltransferase GlmU-like protein